MSTRPTTIARWPGTQIRLPAMVAATPSGSPMGVAGWMRLPTIASNAPAMPAVDPIRSTQPVAVVCVVVACAAVMVPPSARPILSSSR